MQRCTLHALGGGSGQGFAKNKTRLSVTGVVQMSFSVTGVYGENRKTRFGHEGPQAQIVIFGHKDLQSNFDFWLPRFTEKITSLFRSVGPVAEFAQKNNSTKI